MLTKCQSLTRFPWLGLSGNRHHDYTHNNAGSPEQQRILRDITRWHVEEFSQDPLLRSEEHTSELQSHLNLVCRLLLEKKKKQKQIKYKRRNDYTVELGDKSEESAEDVLAEG